MFTGLIEERGKIREIKRNGSGLTLTIQAARVVEDTHTGDSIAINGACQTVTALGSGFFSVFVSRVTADVTTLGSMRPGDTVNLERAIRHDGRLGGHIVQGHIDARGSVVDIRDDSEGKELHISVPQKILCYIAEKGSIAVDGISLTVVSLLDRGFVLYLIPETLQKTDIDTWSVGREVNIEVDILAKYVERMLGAGNRVEKVTKKTDIMHTLSEEGFI